MLNKKIIILLIALIINNAASAALNDTGIKTCSNATQNGLLCPVAGFPGQDAEFGTNSFNFSKVILTTPINSVNWIKKSDFPAASQRDVMYFSMGNKGYFGMTEDQSFWEYDAIENLWIRKSNFPTYGEWRYAPRFVIGNKAYIVEGNKTWEYNQNNNQWIRKSDVPGSSKGGGFGFAIEEKGYVGGGWDNNQNLWEYDAINDQWQQKNNIPILSYGDVCYWGAIAFVIVNKAYVTGTNFYFWEYNPAIDSWTQKAYVPAVYGTAFSINEKGYVFNARGGKLYEYDVVSNNWQQIGTFPGSSRCYPIGYSLNGKGYIGLGAQYIDEMACTVESLNDLYSFDILPNNYTITTIKAGTGTGTVTSTPAGINCGTTCNANFTSGTTIMLTATPAAGSTFVGWSSNCANGQVNLTADTTCTATFNLIITKPTVTTLAATNIAATSATLNGNVASSGDTATVSFDFGTTTAYSSTNLVANPAQVYSSTAVAVSANKTGLTCNALYHYRVKAVNSAGTSYGTDKTFITSTCPVVNSWLYPTSLKTPRDKPFTLEVTAKSDGMQITNYEYIITFDPNKLALIYNTCNNGVCPGTNALTTNQVYLNSNNSLRIVGLGGATVPGNDLQLLIINFRSRTTLGATTVNLQTNSLANVYGDSIGLGARGATINVSTGLCGDADGNTVVNIVDALAIARKVVGMPPPPTIEPLWADVNYDSKASIVDALHIARHSIGLQLPPEVCKIGVAL